MYLNSLLFLLTLNHPGGEGGRLPQFFLLHISSSSVEKRFYPENQPPRMSRSLLKVSLGGGWVGGSSKYFVTPNSC